MHDLSGFGGIGRQLQALGGVATMMNKSAFEAASRATNQLSSYGGVTGGLAAQANAQVKALKGITDTFSATPKPPVGLIGVTFSSPPFQ